MPMKNKSIKSILVTGDFTIDWNIARKRGSSLTSALWNSEDCTRACVQRGGAALLGDLIEEVVNQMDLKTNQKPCVNKIKNECTSIEPGDKQFHHSYSLWSLFNDKDGFAWRVSEFIGIDRNDDGLNKCVMNSLKDSPNPDLIIIDDSDLGFRKQSEIWMKYFDGLKKEPWIILKMSCPVAEGPLWEYLHQKYSENLIVVMDINDLRRTEVQISKELSWERTTQDLVWELTHNPRINSLSNCTNIIVSFDTAGALNLSGKRGKIFYDRAGIEGTWSKKYPGGMIGYNCCLTASIAHQIIRSCDMPDISAGIQAGIAAMRKLHLVGYGDKTEKSPTTQLAFPFKTVSAEILKNEICVTEDEVQDPVRFLGNDSSESKIFSQQNYWTILDNRKKEESLASLAENIVQFGESAALSNIPLGQFGNLTTADRREIESFRTIRSLMAEYRNQNRKSRPLSIGVFGAPGSGKSFGITEVANSLDKNLFKRMEFNLSQLTGIDALYDALHQVRDVGLSGSIPLVFWDEFDTVLENQPLGWLKYFLAPMQDGSFQQGQITHPIGQSIFIFAGGTSETLENFGKEMEEKDFRKVKGPDFVSRLKGFINIMGPNPANGDTITDPYYIIRRAILLRSLLSRVSPQIVDKNIIRIDPGVLTALLQISKYKHGARSMESIITMSQLSGKNRFERSSLPPESQLKLHVDGFEFLSTVQQIVLTPDILEKLAEAAHQVYCDGKKRDGWKVGKDKSEVDKTHPWLVPYEELPESAKMANRITVRLIPRKLAAAGYIMVSARNSKQVVKVPGADLEILARLEHELWMQAKLAAGFKLGKPTMATPNRNEYLVEWDKLSEKIKNIDRDLIKGIPAILAKAGYTIEKLHK
jgi:hypothetical protein